MSFDILCQPGNSLLGNFLPSAEDADELGAAFDRNQESLNGEPQERRAAGWCVLSAFAPGLEANSPLAKF
jgi:hypothetical protein